jgi:uncharacterized protein YjaZ
MFICEKREKRLKDLKVPVEDLVSDVLLWCGQNFPSDNYQDLSVELFLSDLRQKTMGSYHPQPNLIRLFVSPKLEIVELVDTILHEYQHHLDLAGKDLEPRRSKLFYSLNPLEIKARKFASANRNKCLKIYKKKWLGSQKG